MHSFNTLLVIEPLSYTALMHNTAIMIFV